MSESRESERGKPKAHAEPPPPPTALTTTAALARFARVGLVFALFVVFATSLVKLGSGESSAMLDRAAHPDVAIAVVGDSRAHAGVSPTRIAQSLAQAGLQGDGFNFAVNGTDTLHHEDFVVHGLLEKGRPPRVIIWAPNPLGFNDSRTSNRLEQITRMDLGLLRRVGAPFELQLDVLTMRLFPPYKRRPLVAAKIADYTERAGRKSLRLQTRLLGLTWEDPPLSREYVLQPDGHEPFTILAWKDRFDRGVGGYVADYAGLGPIRWHLEVGRELIRRARAAGIVVIVVELPVAPTFQRTFALDPRHLKWREELTRIVNEEGAIYWNHSNLYDDDLLFGDPAHMAVATSYMYSTWLGEQLAKEPSVRAALAPVAAPEPAR